MSIEERDQLLRAIEGQGEMEIAICGLRDEFGDDQPEMVISAASFDPKDLFDRTVLGHVDTAMFSESETWAIACSPDGFSLLAGTSQALAAMTETLGGSAHLRSRLESLIDEGEFGSPAGARSRIVAAIDELGTRGSRV